MARENRIILDSIINSFSFWSREPERIFFINCCSNSLVTVAGFAILNGTNGGRKLSQWTTFAVSGISGSGFTNKYSTFSPIFLFTSGFAERTSSMNRLILSVIASFLTLARTFHGSVRPRRTWSTTHVR